MFSNICLSLTFAVNVCVRKGVCEYVCIRSPAGSLQRALVRISCPLATTSSVSMPPIDGRIDPLFDCLDNLCEFQHNAQHTGFKDARAGHTALHSCTVFRMPAVIPESSFFLMLGASRAQTCASEFRISSYRLYLRADIGGVQRHIPTCPIVPLSVAPTSCITFSHSVQRCDIKINDLYLFTAHCSQISGKNFCTVVWRPWLFTFLFPGLILVLDVVFGPNCELVSFNFTFVNFSFHPTANKR